MKLKLHLVFCVLFSIATINLFAQKQTLYDQLLAVNPEWKNQPDIDPALFCTPANETGEQQLLRFHLHNTEELLRKRGTDGLTPLQKKNRLFNLNTLHAYWQNGVFPINDLHLGRQPYFIDKFNTYCAVGYLMQQSGGDGIAREIMRTQNFSYLKDISDPRLMDWVTNSGLSVDELALIQPAYEGEWPPAVTEIHYNNAGVDVGEYIEVHQNAATLDMVRDRFATILFYDHLDVLYKTMQIAEMQFFTGGLSKFYYYNFPANESLADSGKIELLNNVAEVLQTFSYNSSGVTQVAQNTTRQFNVFEDNNTPPGSSLGFCGRYYTTSGPEAWQPSVNAATPGVFNPCLILPLKLSQFSYVVNKGSVQLKWQTSMESNVSHYWVERSNDGINFSSTGKVKAAGNTTTAASYNFTDNNPGFVNHYRLKMVDNDGAFTYTQILYVKFAAANPIKIVTNPVHDLLKIQLNAPPTGTGSILIFDLHGKKMLQTVTGPAGNEINVSAFPAGKYILQYRLVDGNVYNLPFIKE